MKEDVIFWSVDCQKDFMLKKGKLYVKGAEGIFDNLRKITNLAKEENIKVISTGDFHGPSTEEISNTPDFIKTFPEHCMGGTEGAEFIDEVNPKYKDKTYYIVNSSFKDKLNINKLARSRNIIVYKDKFDVFEGNKYTKNIINILSPKLVIIYGVTTSICVNFAVMGFLDTNIKVVVVKDAIKCLSEENSKKTIDNWIKKGVLLTETKMLSDIL